MIKKNVKKVPLTSEQKKERRKDRDEAVNTVVKAANGFKIVMQVIGGILGLAALIVFLYTMVAILRSCEQIIVH
jgi:hypothetical protein